MSETDRTATAAPPRIARRDWLGGVTAAAITAAAAFQAGPLPAAQPEADQPFRFRYLVGSSMYGYAGLAELLPEVRRSGASAIDLWPKVHGNQREQLDELGEAAFAELLAKHQVTLGCITQYKLGPFGLAEEMRLAQRLGCQTIVTGGEGPKGLSGSELKAAVAAFVEKMRPHVAIAEETGVRIAIENHANNLIDSPDALRWLLDLRPSPHLAIALAPYHLPQDPELLARLIRDLGSAIEVFYAWQHGNGSMTAQPKESELLQLPGRGPLDFGPLVEALQSIRYRGWTEIFMHPFPRGTAIVDSVAGVTAEIRKSADYLETLAGRSR
jgi:sugar phosphate isomerase/epimerase